MKRIKRRDFLKLIGAVGATAMLPTPGTKAISGSVVRGGFISTAYIASFTVTETRINNKPVSEYPGVLLSFQ